MKLWRWFVKHKTVGPEKELQTVEASHADEKLEATQQKLDDTKDKLPELARAVASARRVKYRVDSFTAAMNDNMLRRNNHG